jgi:hypothetical protein
MYSTRQFADSLKSEHQDQRVWSKWYLLSKYKALSSNTTLTKRKKVNIIKNITFEFGSAIIDYKKSKIHKQPNAIH